ncbi:acyl-homoserine-lactone synthase [Cupriavidus basilensis]|uniref:Acyl-homoserine-lactone synthase n=1 Tax=Cupriavidus basilensis TaxID=68895 RepID=A0ABT6AVH8_9BURK|nr:acyl-homoserine-lactone synthase [Cupriavidus basilensis]MDF3836625.1 acyl-homoserine-lactone synthase [Cupriavidus basilensis]
MEIVSGNAHELTPAMMQRIARYRHKVFVESLGWQLRCDDDMELDQFDRPDTVYVAAQMHGEVVGTARLLPTTRPYLLGDVFPQLLNGALPPASAEVWELSRFAATPAASATGDALGHLSSPLAVRLLGAALACAKARGARHLITVSPLGVERLLRNAGFRARRAGVPILAQGQHIVACLIDTACGPRTAARNTEEPALA